MSNPTYINLSTLDKRIEYIVVTNAVSISISGMDHYCIDGDNLKIDANVPLSDSLRCELDVAVERPGHLAFGHYFFESVVFAAYIWQLHGLDSRNRAIVSDMRKFKKITMDFIGVQLTDLLIKERKLIIFRAEMSLNSNSDVTFFNSSVDWFLSRFVRLHQPKMSPVVFLPRQTKENLRENDRSLEYPGIVEYVLSMKGGNVFNADESESFFSQIELIQKARFLIVPDGSAFIVNGYFCRDATIIVLGCDLIPVQARTYNKLKIIKDLISLRNSVVYVKSTDNKFSCNDILPILNRTYLF
jgi:hypothetical protein